jgi:hypothetical protein
MEREEIAKPVPFLRDNLPIQSDMAFCPHIKGYMLAGLFDGEAADNQPRTKQPQKQRGPEGPAHAWKNPCFSHLSQLPVTGFGPLAAIVRGGPWEQGQVSCPLDGNSQFALHLCCHPGASAWQNLSLGSNISLKTFDILIIGYNPIGRKFALFAMQARAVVAGPWTTLSTATTRATASPTAAFSIISIVSISIVQRISYLS